MFKVVYAIDSLDPNPDVWTFDTESEACAFAREEIQRRVDFVTQHSNTKISDTIYQNLWESESSLVRIEEV